MRCALIAGIVIASIVGTVAFQKAGFAEEAKDYQALPEEAKKLVKELRKLDVLVVNGVNYQEYRDAVKPLAPDITVFCEAKSSQQWPTLVFLLRNASACHTATSNLWNKSLFAADGQERHRAKSLLPLYQEHVWSVAHINAISAMDLVDGTEDQAAGVIRVIKIDPQSQTAAHAIDVAEKAFADTLKSRQDAWDRERDQAKRANEEAEREKEEREKAILAEEEARATPETRAQQKAYDRAKASLRAAENGTFPTAAAKRTTIDKRRKALTLAKERLVTARKKAGLPDLPPSERSSRGRLDGMSGG